MSSLYSPLSDLPKDHILYTFITIKALENIAENILDKLDRNENQGNQYLVVLGLTKPAYARLAGDDPRLGSIPYRITLDGSIGIIKLIPSCSHQAVASDLQQQIQRILTTIGVPFSDYAWRRSAIYTGLSSSTQKEPDECLVPGSRMPTGSTQGWPTLVIETGISESLPRLRNDANW
ncbi:hypothetical protein MW887_004131 [Aspergillus wentii]|nr:hypothetical protein MW887_004131 [Aspergillus wentii]